MAFWSSSNLEPTRKHRFKVSLGTDKLLWWAKSVTKPGFEINTNKYTAINHSLEYPGIVSWNDVTLVVVDVGKKAKEIYDKLAKVGYKNPDESTAGGIRKEKSTKDLVITQVDAEGQDIETWELKNFIIKSVAFGDLSYDDDGLVEITMNIAYDWASMT